MDSEEQFLAILDYVGDDHIMGFKFDNSSRKMFKKEEKFNRDEHYIPAIKALRFKEKDVKGTEFFVIVPILNVQGIISIKDERTWDTIDVRFTAW